MSEYIMDKICRGCLSYERVGTKVPNSKLTYGTCLGYTVGDVNCPCQHCLIKPMCNRVCEAFTETSWYRKANDNTYDYDKNRRKIMKLKRGYYG